MHLYTIGFSGKSAETFFALLRAAGVKKLIDIRRSNNTLYSGFTRARDLPYLLRQLCGIAYVYEPQFAPSEELLREHQSGIKSKKDIPHFWAAFEARYMQEISGRPIQDLFAQHTTDADSVCLLCTEATPEHCHRRLLAERLRALAGPALEVTHL